MPAPTARNFNGTNANITCAVGNSQFTQGPGTMAGVCKSATDSVRGRILTVGAAGTNWSLDKSASDLIEWTDNPATSLNVKVADGWVLIATSKDTGTVKPRMHKYVYTTGVWSHEDAAATAANITSTGGNALIGSGAASNFWWPGDIALVAVWDIVLTDVQVETLPLRLKPWFDVKQPRGLWLLNQATTSIPVLDLTDGKANQTAIAGTSISSGSFPNWNFEFDLGPQLPLGVMG